MQSKTTASNSNIWSFDTPLTRDLEAVFSAIPSGKLLRQLGRPNDRRGPKGFPSRSLLNVFIASYHCKHESIADTVRQLQDNPNLAIACGLDPQHIPSRPTLSRFFARMTNQMDLVKDALLKMSDLLKSQVPEFGDNVAIDSSVVPSYSSIRHEPYSDGDASWTAKNDAKTKGGKKWVFGYKLHLMVDVATEIPICGYVTTASQNDSTHLTPLLEMASQSLSWFTPKTVSADKGYDSLANYESIRREYNSYPVIPMRELRKGAEKRRPNSEMRTDYDRDSSLWKKLYRGRWSVERTFSRLKETRRLGSHKYRGLAKVELHCLLAVLSLQAKAVVQAINGKPIRQAVRKVA